MVKALFPNVTLIERHEVRGFATNQNELFHASENQCTYVLMLNDDTVVGPETVTRLRSAIEKDARMAAMGPRLVYADGRFQTAGERLPGFWYHLLRHVGVGRFVPDSLRFRLGGRIAPSPDGRTIREVGYVIGACVLIRTEALRDVGPLDERFQMYGEDADWCGECWRRGWKIGADPTTTVVHHRRQSWSSFSLIERERGMFTYLRKRQVGRFRLGLLRTVFLVKYRTLLIAASAGRAVGIARHDPETINTLKMLVEVGLHS
jgi:GT2 family glycosyltransferase